MSTWIRVARYQLTALPGYLGLVLSWVLVFLASLVRAAASAPPRPGEAIHYFVSIICVFFLLAGAQGPARQLPFALALGVSRRSFYAGTALFAGAIAAVAALGVTVLQLIERATGGWGLNLHYFRVPYLLAGPWYLTWLTSFAGLTLMLAWGMWFATIYRRWNLPGLLAFIAAQALALLAIYWAHHWHGWLVSFVVGTLTIGGLTGLLAALALALLAGGYATMRRITV